MFSDFVGLAVWLSAHRRALPVDLECPAFPHSREPRPLLARPGLLRWHLFAFEASGPLLCGGSEC